MKRKKTITVGLDKYLRNRSVLSLIIESVTHK